MAEISQYRPGNKAPNNGVYIEKAKREVVVRGPQQVELNTGETFTDTTNGERVWKNKRHRSKGTPEGL